LFVTTALASTKKETFGRQSSNSDGRIRGGGRHVY
jgi:hypothetical protein